jgi:hypothetical protein
MRSLALSLLGSLALAACGGDGGGGGDAGPSVDAAPPPTDAPVVPAFRNPVDLPDAELAPQALALIEASCEDSGCHDITRQRLRYWRGLADQSLAGCLTDLTASAPEKSREMLDCTRLASKRFAPKSLGVIASGGNLAWFEFQFQRAYGADAAEELAAFRDEAAMPRGERTPFSQAQFDIVMEWFLRGEGLPLIDDLLPEDPAPTTCEGSVSAEVGRHVAAMATTGWSAVNRDEGLLMHGCAGAGDPKGCLTSYPAAATTAFGASWQTIAGATLRVLRDNDYPSAYWTRSSADGRFIGHGRDAGRGQPGAAVIDLAPAGGEVIPVQALYDPGFFPDNSGFMFQGSASGGAKVCLHSVLTSATGTITLREPGCGDARSVGLYQHVGRALGGGDYWTVDGQFQSDDQGKQVGRADNVDPSVQAGSEADLQLTALVNTGTSFVEGANVDIPVRFEADAVMAPSAKLVVTRFGGANDKQLGFVLRRMDVTGTAQDFTAELPEIARYCYQGGKPAFSLDERWLVVHHYLTDADAVDLGFTGPTDPAFASYRRDGGANLYLIDLVSGTRTRITRVGPGQFALFPHFRSDGWIYFVVRDPGAAGGHREYMVASDAALVLGGD